MRTNFFLNNLPRKLLYAAQWLRNVRSYDSDTRRTRLPGPPSIQIQTIDRCNATCIMCPYSSRDKSVRANLMADDLFRHIMDEIRRSGNTRTVCLMLQNEPLLDRKLPDRVRIAKEVLGSSARVITVTNGAPLTPAIIEELIASRIDGVSVSIDAFNEDTYNRIRRGLDFRRVVGNTLSLAERMGPGRVDVSFLRQRENEGEEDAFAVYWRRQGIKVRFKEPTNRAGTLDSYERVRKARPALWKKLVHPILNRLIPACPHPFTVMTVLWDGRVVTCCEDWEPRDTVGDLSKQSLKDVWNGERINHYRHLLRNHQSGESLVCSDCSLSKRYWRI